MAQPTAYTPAADFSDDEASAVGGRSTVRTAALDAEFSALNTTLDGVLTNLALNQRDDGEIRDGRVKVHTLAADVRALFTAGGVDADNLRGDWVTATAYVALDLVSQSGNTYMCAVAHTSGTFATDLAADKWLLIALGSTVAASAVAFTPTASISAVTVQAAIEESDTEVRALATAAAVASQLADVTTAARGDALVGWSAVFSVVDGVLTRHASLAAAVSAVGSTRCTIVVRDDITMAASSTIPATASLEVQNRARITTTGYTLTVNGRFICPPHQCFSGSGTVIFDVGAVDAVFPQWFGAVGDGVIADGSGTDSTAAFASAIAATCENGVSDVSVHPLVVPPGNYVVGALSFPPAFKMVGAGRHMVNFVAKTGTTGVWFGDAGNAAKIVLENFAMYGRSLSGITYGIRLGYTVDHGTEGHLRDLFVRDIDGASALWGIDVRGNVGYYDWLTTYDCTSGIRIAGAANMATHFAPYACTTVGCDLTGTDLHGLELEAPGNSCIPLRFTGSASVSGCTVSLANGTTISHLVEIGGSATTWEVRNFRLVFGDTPAGITVSNGNFKRASDSSYFGGNATAGSFGGEGHYSSDHNGQKLQAFYLRITNTAGTLQHRISTASGGACSFASAINGATNSLTNTPTGADGSTAMAGGGKIGSAATSVFYFDTRPQRDGDHLFQIGDVFTTTGQALTALAYVTSININGTTRTRLAFQFFDEASGAVFALTTANIGASEIVQVPFYGYLTH